MQQLLTGRMRLPGFSGEWEVKKLGSIGTTYGGLTGKSKVDFQNGQFPYIPFMNIMSNPIIDTTYFDYVHVAAHENQNRTQKGDLFFNGSSETPQELGMCSVLLHDIPNLFLNSFCFGFRGRSKTIIFLEYTHVSLLSINSMVLQWRMKQTLLMTNGRRLNRS